MQSEFYTIYVRSVRSGGTKANENDRNIAILSSYCTGTINDKNTLEMDRLCKYSIPPLQSICQDTHLGRVLAAQSLRDERAIKMILCVNTTTFVHTPNTSTRI